MVLSGHRWPKQNDQPNEHPWLPQVYQALQEQMFKEHACLVETVMGPHRVSYPDDAVPEFVMSNGQLMGSPRSFPHLCAINAVALWESIEEWLSRRAGKPV